MADNRLFTQRGEAKGRRRGLFQGERLRIALVAGIIVLLAWNIFFVDWGGSDAIKSTKGGGGSSQTREAGGGGSDEGGEEARAIIAQAKQGDASKRLPDLFSQAEAFTRDGKKADAYLLHFFLVKQGHGPSAMVLAEMADPSFYDAKKSFLDGPDFAQARKWYLQARVLGHVEADQRLADMKLRVKAAATGGDENARRLLVGW